MIEDWHPTLLCTPAKYGLPKERILPSSPAEYTAEDAGQCWMLVVTVQGGLVYFGPGPASVVRSPAPF